MRPAAVGESVEVAAPVAPAAYINVEKHHGVVVEEDLHGRIRVALVVHVAKPAANSSGESVRLYDIMKPKLRLERRSNGTPAMSGRARDQGQPLANATAKRI